MLKEGIQKQNFLNPVIQKKSPANYYKSFMDYCYLIALSTYQMKKKEAGYELAKDLSENVLRLILKGIRLNK